MNGMKVGKEIEIETLNLKFLIEKLEVAEQQLKDGSDDLHFRLSHFRKRVSEKDKEKYDDYFFGINPSKEKKEGMQAQGIVAFEEPELLPVLREKKDPWIKKIYRRIVSSTHPDKFQNFSVENLKQKYLNIYRKTVNAWNEGEDDVILVAAYDTDIKVVNPKALSVLRDGSKKKNIRLQEIQKLLAYQWHHVPIKDRSKTLEMYLKKLGYEFTTEEIKNVVNLARKRKVGTRPKSLRERKNVK
jgi:hypothetical protein